LLALQLISLLWGGVGFAAEQNNYFQGKTLRIIVGFPPGGGVDADARMIARFLASHSRQSRSDRSKYVRDRWHGCEQLVPTIR
jgi:tripartite-type tricarboxylate transporter receptor subunit TctC